MNHVKRRVPRWTELRHFLQFDLPTLNVPKTRLTKAADLSDIRRLAMKRVPQMVFDYVEGGAGDELTLAANRQTFQSTRLVPRALRDVSKIDLTTRIAGGNSALPFGIAPTGFTRLMHAAGEKAGYAAASKAGIPFSLSTMGTTSVEELSTSGPDGRRWFQLYLWKDRDKSQALVERARNAGFDTLLLTVDTPVGGSRHRDRRNGLSIPPRVNFRNVIETATHFPWWYDFLTTDPLTFASLSGHAGDLGDLINNMFDPALTIDDLTWLRNAWPGRLLVKGVLNDQDALRVIAAGADGLVVSNHGGRQLDRAEATLLALPKIRKAVGNDVEIILDSGIMSGADIVTALAAGADFTLIGRAYLYGLMAGGGLGVEKIIEILKNEIVTTMSLLGVTSVQDLCPELLDTSGQAVQDLPESAL